MTTATAPTIDPHGTCENQKLIAVMDVISRHEDNGEVAFAMFRDLVMTGVLSKDIRPKLSDDERQARADAADKKARLQSSARHWLDSNPPANYVKEDRTTYKSLPELMDAMAVPRVERDMRYQGILRHVLDNGMTDWGLVLVRDGVKFYGSKPRLLQYATAA